MSIRSWLVKIGRQAQPRRSGNEIIAHEWLSLKTLWRSVRESVPEARRAEIDVLLPSSPNWGSGPADWHALNAAEQAIGSVLPEPRLSIEFAILLELAKSRKLTNLTVHERNAALFADPPVGTPASGASASGTVDIVLDRKRAAYAVLLDDLQRWFINTRFNRRLRRETATRLVKAGLVILALALLPFAAYYGLVLASNDTVQIGADGVAIGHKLFSHSPAFGLAMVGLFGVLGAYFSRIIRFQTEVATLGFDEVTNIYQSNLLYVRLMCGLVGAVIFYFLLRGGILAGGIFPNLSNISIGEQVVWKAGIDGMSPVHGQDGKLVPSGLTILAPTPELAKLIVWSFLAGFSERLVPDALERTEARAREVKAS